jgi:allantoin racemase
VRLKEPVRLLLIEPVTPPLMGDDTLRGLRSLLGQGTRLDHISLKNGPSSIETDAEAAQATPEIVFIAEESQGRYDAIVVACVGDVGVAASRARSRIPVFGPGQAAMQAAAAYGSRFSIVVATSQGIAEMTRLAGDLGFGASLTSVRTLGIPITGIAHDLAQAQAALVREARLAASVDGAKVVIVGCSAATGVWRGAQAALAQIHPGVRLIEPLSWSVVLAEALVRVESSPSCAAQRGAGLGR